MLRDMLSKCLDSIEQETDIPREQVMAYVHYPPSVYQLHVHFAFPYGQYGQKDSYRIHSLQSIITNLEIDPEYYTKATLCLSLYKHSPYYIALNSEWPDDCLTPLLAPDRPGQSNDSDVPDADRGGKIQTPSFGDKIKNK
jgi:hypothetical protein